MRALASGMARAHATVRAMFRVSVLMIAIAGCATKQAQRPWVGTWRMIAVESRDSAIGPWRRPFGDAPSGYVFYNADGSHAMNFTRTPVIPMFAAGSDRAATDAEVRATYEGYFSWFGSYTVDVVRGTIIHRIEGSLWPSWRNTVQERPFTIRGDTMLLGDLIRSRRVLVRAR